MAGIREVWDRRLYRWIVTIEQTLALGLLVVVALSAPIRGLAAVSEVGGTLVNARFETLSLEAGLSQSFVYAIAQDRHGFLWFGTQDGLNRFDGKRFTIFDHDPADPTTISDEAIRVLLVDSAGVLWIGSDGGGLSQWESRRDGFINYQHDPADPNSIANDRVRSIFEDSQGNLWLGMEGGGLDRFDRGSGHFEHHRVNPAAMAAQDSDQIWDIAEDENAHLWLATAGGLYLFDRGTDSFIGYFHDPNDSGSLSSNETRKLSIDTRGGVWVGTENDGLNRLDRSTGRVERFVNERDDARSLSSNKVNALIHDERGLLWVGTLKGLNVFDPQKRDFTRYLHDPRDAYSLGNDTVNAIYQDNGQLLWFGTHNGLSRWDPHMAQVIHYLHRPGVGANLSENLVTSFAESIDARVWVGTYGGGLNRLEPATSRFDHYRHDPDDPGSLSGDYVMALHESADGVLWVGTAFSGLNRLDAEGFTHYRHDASDPSSLSDDTVSFLYRDRQGTLWVATYGGGLNRFDADTNTFTRYRHDPEDNTTISDDQIVALYEDSLGMLWVGTYGGGLNRFDPATDGFVRFLSVPDDANGLSGDGIYTIVEDVAGNLWIGTQSRGLNVWSRSDRLEGKAVFRHLTERDGLPSDTIYSSARADDGDLWFSTGRGLFSIAPGSSEIRRLGMGQGLQGLEFNLAAGFKAADGRLYFGGTNGFNVFHPEEITPGARPPPVVITSVGSADWALPVPGRLDSGELLTLDYRDYLLRFEFAALDYASPEENRFAYMLEGLDPDWIEAGNSSQVTYSNLEPGSYRFRVKAANSDGVWNEQGASLALQVSAPPWRSGMSYAIYFAVGVALLLLLMRFQVARARHGAALKHAVALEQVNAELTEEIRTREFAEAAKHKAESQLAQAQRLTAIGQLTGGIAHDFNNLLTVIIGSLDLLKLEMDKGGNSQNASLLNEAMTGAMAGAALTRQLLAFARRRESDPERIDAAHFGRRNMALLRRAAGEQVEFSASIQGEALLIDVDPGQLTTALLNLVINAREARSNQMKFRIDVLRLPSRDVDLPPDIVEGDYVVFELIDDGRGMTDEEMDRAFEPFYSTKSFNAGAGLGLSMVYGFARQAGGTALMRRLDGSGVSACLLLPLRDGSVSVDDSSMETTLAPENSPGLALVVEDQHAVRVVTSAFLKSMGFEVTSAADAEEAIRLVESGVRPDFCFIDVVMPGTMDGIDLAKWLSGSLPETEILLTTGYADDRFNAEVPFPVLRKPYRIEELSTYLRAVVSKRRSESIESTT